MLTTQTGFAQTVLDPALLAFPKDMTSRKDLAAELASAWRRGGLILCISPIGPDGPTSTPDLVMRGLAEVAANVIKEASPDGVFLSGGDTAESVWREIGAEAILLIEEILPGLMRGEFLAGPLNGLPVATKAGTFGSPQTLVQLYALLS